MEYLNDVYTLYATHGFFNSRLYVLPGGPNKRKGIEPFSPFVIDCTAIFCSLFSCFAYSVLQFNRKIKIKTIFS